MLQMGTKTIIKKLADENALMPSEVSQIQHLGNFAPVGYVLLSVSLYILVLRNHEG